MVWALSVEHFPTLSLWSQHGTQSWIILGNFSILAKNHHWKKQMIGSYRIYFETCTAYWHCLRFSRQSALVCSDYSLDPKKKPVAQINSKTVDILRDLDWEKLADGLSLGFCHAVPCSAGSTHPTPLELLQTSELLRCYFAFWCWFRILLKPCCWDDSACECYGLKSWTCGKMIALCLVLAFCFLMSLHSLGLTWQTVKTFETTTPGRWKQWKQ